MLLHFFCLIMFLTTILGSGLNILSMGDWGGENSSPYYTSQEVATANMMNYIAEKYNSSFVLALGDNFYDSGVTSVDDPRFQETFEDIFNGQTLLSTPFYILAGNHDWRGNVSAQIDYSSKSNRWIFPNYWYNKIFDIPGYNTKLEIIMIDTVTLAGPSEDLDFCNKYNISKKDCNIEANKGPNDIKLSEDEWDWINKTLKSSTADYVIVAGHYPIWSIGEHGPTSILVAQLRPLLKQYNVQLYINGHDHSFQYILDTSYSDTGYIVNGGAHVCDSDTSHTNDIPKNSLKFYGCVDGGFIRIHIEDTMKVYYYYGNNSTVIYETNEWSPRDQTNK